VVPPEGVISRQYSAAKVKPAPGLFTPLRKTLKHVLNNPADNGRDVSKEDLRLLRFAHVVSALRSVCASAISGNSGVGEKPLSADASKA